MTKPQQRDTVDCLIAELTDAYKALARVEAYPHCGDECAVFFQEWAGDAQVAIERAVLLVSDLKAAHDARCVTHRFYLHQSDWVCEDCGMNIGMGDLKAAQS